MSVDDCNNFVISERDKRELSIAEIDYFIRTKWPADAAPSPRTLKIPSICLRDQAMPMMLGDGFGGCIGE
jgi:hypothetical protein